MLSEHLFPQSGDVFYLWFVSRCKKCLERDGEKHGPFDAQQWVTAPAEEGGAAGVATGSTTPAQGLGLPSVSWPPLLTTCRGLTPASN